jgi:L-rhamnose mutarotase
LAGNAASAGRGGWHNYSLFLRDDGLLVGYVETTISRALERMAANGVNSRWQAEMAGFFEGVPGARRMSKSCRWRRFF